MKLYPGSVVSLTVNSPIVGDSPLHRDLAAYVSGTVTLSSRTAREVQGFNLRSRQIFTWTVEGASLQINGGGKEAFSFILRRPDSGRLDLTLFNSKIEAWLAHELHPHCDLLWTSLLWHSFLDDLRAAWADACGAIAGPNSPRLPIHAVKEATLDWAWVRQTVGVEFTIGAPEISPKVRA